MRSKYALITKFKNYWLQHYSINHGFTTADVFQFIESENLINEKSGEPYSETTIKSVLANADLKNLGSKNKNKKFLISRDDYEKRIYFFDPRHTSFWKNILVIPPQMELPDNNLKIGFKSDRYNPFNDY